MSPRETWGAWPTVWKARGPQDNWEDGMRTLFGNNGREQYRLFPDALHDGEGGELCLAVTSSIPTPICTIMIRTRPRNKQEIRQLRGKASGVDLR
jgi:hypothetical protein